MCLPHGVCDTTPGFGALVWTAQRGRGVQSVPPMPLPYVFRQLSMQRSYPTNRTRSKWTEYGNDRRNMRRTPLLNGESPAAMRSAFTNDGDMLEKT